MLYYTILLENNFYLEVQNDLLKIEQQQQKTYLITHVLTIALLNSDEARTMIHLLFLFVFRVLLYTPYLHLANCSLGIFILKQSKPFWGMFKSCILHAKHIKY